MAKYQAPYQGVYGMMDFGDYKFEEYPKVVGYADDKKTIPIIVKDAREEVAFISAGAPGAKRTLEDELRDDLIRKELELEMAKEELAKIKAATEKVEQEAEKKAEEAAKAAALLPASAKVPGK